jgi:hypothetical protein
MAKRVTIAPGDSALRTILAGKDGGGPAGEPSKAAAVAERCAAALRRGHVHVEPHFLSGALLEESRAAALDCLQSNCDVAAQLSAPLLRLVAVVDELRAALAPVTGRALLESAELSVLGYRPGGSCVQPRPDRTATRSLHRCCRATRPRSSLSGAQTDGTWTTGRVSRLARRGRCAALCRCSCT